MPLRLTAAARSGCVLGLLLPIVSTVVAWSGNEQGWVFFLRPPPTQTNTQTKRMTHTAIFENGDFVAVAVLTFCVIIRDNS